MAEKNLAEALLEMAEAIRSRPGKLIDDLPAYMGKPGPLARADLALKFSRLPPMFNCGRSWKTGIFTKLSNRFTDEDRRRQEAATA